MSKAPVQAYVDTRKGFQQEQQVSGSIELSRMPRLGEMLSSSEGAVALELRLARNTSGQRLIIGHVQASLSVTCQRCLEPLVIELQDDINLALVEDEEAAARLEPSLDPWIIEDHKLDLASLAEEQLMLCMPIVSYHKHQCRPAEAYQVAPEQSQIETAGQPGDNPFSVLKSLKESD